MIVTIKPSSSYYSIKNLHESHKFSEDFWNHVKIEHEIIPTNDVEGRNAQAKRIYDELAAVAIPRICKLHGVTPDVVGLYFSHDYFETIAVWDYECNFVCNMEITAPTPESQAAIDILRDVNPCVDYPGSHVLYYCSSEDDETEAWEEICKHLIKTHYIEPVARYFELDVNDFEIDYFEHEMR